MTNRVFAISNQRDFAHLSGDFNPVHIDPIYARRTIFGGVAVHGIHLLLWALDQWKYKESTSVKITRLNCEFKSPVIVDDRITLKFIEMTKTNVQMDILVNHVSKAVITVEAIPDSNEDAQWVIDKLFEQKDCSEKSDEQLRNASGKASFAAASKDRQKSVPITI